MVYDLERENLEKIAKHFDVMQIPHKFQDIGNIEQERFPSLICVFRYKELDFDVIIYNLAQWIHVKCLVIRTKGLKTKKKAALFGLALELNYDLPECTFSAFQENIYIEIDSLVGISFNDFRAEFESIGEGIEAFISKAQKDFKIQIKSTKEHEHSDYQRSQKLKFLQKSKHSDS